jgi:hypothetical protein
MKKNYMVQNLGMKKLYLAILFAPVLMLLTAPVQASTIDSITYYFTSDHMTGGYGSSGPFGTVVLTQDGTAVDFVVTLQEEVVLTTVGQWFKIGCISSIDLISHREIGFAILFEEFHGIN